MRLRSLSLRYKFLAIMALLLAGSMFSYLTLAVHLFNDDKLSYVYDGNASLANLLANETKTTLQGSLKTLHLIGLTVNQKFRSDSEKTAALNALLQADDNLVAVAVFSEGANPEHDAPIFTSYDPKYLQPYNLNVHYYEQARLRKPIPSNIVRASGVYFQNVSLAGGAPLMNVGVLFHDGGHNQILIGSLRQDRLLKMFTTSNLYTTYLIDAKGQILIHPDIHKVLSNESMANIPIIREVAATQIPNGAREYSGRNKISHILAYAHIDQGNLTVISEIEKDKAFLASRKLIERSILFAIMIVAVSLVVSVLFTNKLTGSLRKLFDATLHIAQGDFNVRVAVASGDEIGHLAGSFNAMAGKITALMQETAEKAKLERELDTARMVQSTFFPTEQIMSGALSVVGQYQPATQCGGDWWGHFSSSAGIDFVFIADAMGHGVPAALVTAMAYASCTTLAEIIKNQKLHNNSPGQILETFNRVLYDAVRGKISMTFFAAVFDSNTGKLTYANGGHNFPVLLPLDPKDNRVGAAARSAHKDDGVVPISLILKGSPLGLDRSATFEEKTMELRAGDKLFLFTDGLIECKAPDGKAWGRKTMIKNVLGYAEQNAEAVKTGIIKQAFEFFAERPLDDDITIVVAEISKQWQPKTKNVSSVKSSAA